MISSQARNSKGPDGPGPVPAERLKVEGEASLGKTVVKLIATGLGSGYSPFAPGTAGTLVAIPLYLALSSLSWPLYLVSHAFIYNRRFGLFFLLGLIVDVVFYKMGVLQLF